MNKPFAKRAKIGIKKQRPIEQETQQHQENEDNPPPIKSVSSKLSKPQTKNIYDALKKQESASGSTNVHKPTLSFKKNKLLKPSNAADVEESTELASGSNPIRTPLLTGGKGKLKLGKSREKPVIREEAEEEEPNHWDKYNQNQQNEPDQAEESTDANPIRDSPSSKLIKPKLFKGIGQGSNKNHHKLTSSPSGANEGRGFKPSNIQNNRSEVYQEYETEENPQPKISYQQMMNIEATEINLKKTSTEPFNQEVSESKRVKQEKRAKQLSGLLNLENDLFEELISIGNTTPFEVYISKIKGGYLKNSSDQAFEDKSEVGSQTIVYGEADFTNQCPEDYNSSSIDVDRSSEENRFEEFLLRAAPVIEELISPAKYTIMPPMSLLAFNPTFLRFVKCPVPMFIYKSHQKNQTESRQLSLIAIAQKLIICQGQISCALDLGGMKIAGLKNGKIVLWNGQNDKSSKLYAEIASQIQSTNFQLPACETSGLERLSSFTSEGSIVSLIESGEKGEFWSFDSHAKLIRWRINTDPNKSRQKTALSPEQVVEVSKISQKRHLVGFSAKKRAQTFYLHTSSGIFCLAHQTDTEEGSGKNLTLSQIVEVGPIAEFYLPKRTDLIYCLSEPSTIKILSLACPEQNIQVEAKVVPSQSEAEKQTRLRELIFPQIEHENREITMFYHILAVSEVGELFEIKLTEDEQKLVPIKTASKGEEESEEEDNIQSMRSIKDNKKDVFKAVNYLANQDEVEIIKIHRDLRCESHVLNLKGYLQSKESSKAASAVHRVKEVLIKNKKFLEFLNQNSKVLM